MPSIAEGVALAGITACAILLVIAGVQLFKYERPVKEKVRLALDQQLDRPSAVRDDGGAGQRQAGVGATIKHSFEGLAEFAKALKELETSTRLFLIAVAFLLVALAAAALASLAP
ncbi:hypothetical protein ABZ345_44460 [Lentzea sp. NPDC005914]|uniref:hypothetical protein n=1 Tax=Lentzea sp. NPDC005914 TaxID=3154572 RepID=UPI00340AB89C